MPLIHRYLSQLSSLDLFQQWPTSYSNSIAQIIPKRTRPLSFTAAIVSERTHRGSLGSSALLKGHLTIMTLFHCENFPGKLCSLVPGTTGVEFAALNVADSSNAVTCRVGQSFTQ